MSDAQREKRLTKPPIAYEIPKICYPRKRKKKQKKKAIPESSYQIIPCPLKFLYTCTIYPMYGDINLREHEGTLVADTTLLNQGLSCKDIQIIEGNTHKLIHLTLDVNFKFQLPPWQHIVNKLKKSGTQELTGWANVIENYSTQYENMLRSYSSKEINLNAQEEERLRLVDLETKKKVNKLFRKYPCINFKTKFKNSNMHITDICPNDGYLHELGYSVDTFTLTVLREGVPNLVPVNNTHTIRALMENYQVVEKSNEQKTDEFNSSIMIKNGYTRQIRYKVYYLPTYEEGCIGFDCLIIMTGKESSSNVSSETPTHCSLNKQFLEQMIAKEQESNIFLKKFYNLSIQQKYASIHKTCRVKELMNTHEEESLITSV